ncbi:MAG: hypothetical protein JNK29_11005 [Anaerolineales bacterium]|nr:hypothetical protein [Anaerolineales bacterium]
MKIWIDRTNCDACTSYCDRHAAKLVRFPEGEDRPCIKQIEDDGSPLLTLIVKDGDLEATLTLTDEQRQIVALEGLSILLPWYRHN